jgi:CRP/FNR family cyclic AMP-dependent transcriptional regulator
MSAVMSRAVSPVPGPALPPDVGRRLAAVAIAREFERADAVFRQGDAADGLHLITRGRFAVRSGTRRGDSTMLAILGPGAFFGEVALLTARPIRSVTVVALDRAETLFVRRDAFDELLEETPFLRALVRMLAERLRLCEQGLVEAVRCPAEARVRRRLLQVRSVLGPAGDPMLVQLTQEVLAELAGTSRATVNRVLRNEERLGTVRLARSAIRIIDREALARRAS